MSWLASVVNPVFSRASSLANSNLFIGAAGIAGAGIAAEGIASTAHNTVIHSLPQHSAEIPLPVSHGSAPKTAKLQADEHRYYNTIESLSQHNAETSGTHTRSDHLLAKVIPDHVIDGVSAGFSKAFGATASEALPPSSSLAYQSRRQTWEDLTHSLTLMGQGLATLAAPFAMGWGAVKAAQFFKAGSLEAFASHRFTQGVGQVAAAALFAHADPGALALSPPSRRRAPIGSSKEVVTEPIKKTTRIVESWELGNNATGQRYRAGWLEDALKEVRNPTGFAAVTVPIALEIANKVTRAEAIDAVKNRKPGERLAITPFPELDEVSAFAKKYLSD